MAALNEAWRVLSDPARRAMYDASLRPAATAIGERALPTDDMYRAVPRLEHDARGSRFPVLPLAVSFVVLCALILIFGSRGDKGTAPAADWRIEVGSCVSIRQNLDAVEVGCDAPHDGVVRLLVPFDTSCPIDTETHRDQQGLGNVCVDPVGA